jgi:parallel beta-helix repeat protein
MRSQISLAALALALCAVPSDAAQLFVSTTGNDSWPGTAAQPWRTLQTAANRVVAGDHVTVRAGNYAGFNLTADGTPADPETGAPAVPITFFAEPGVLINQPNPVRPDHGINLENASDVVIDGFSVTGMQRAGVRAVGMNGTTFASKVTIRNVTSFNNGYWGILTGFVNDVLIENNTTYGSAVEHGIYVSNSGDRPIIRNNTVFDNRGNGIHMNGDASLGGDGIISDAVVSGNVIYNNAKLNAHGQPGGGSGINMDGVQDSLIVNNLLYNNHASGISLYSIDGGGGSSDNIVVNNTVYMAADARWALNIQNGSTDNMARNNILLNLHPSRGAINISSNSLSGFTSDYNAVISRFTTNGGNSNQTLAQWQTSTGQDVHSFIATAAQLFGNPANDFHLLPTAPAINAGTSAFAPLIDLEGNPRPVGAGFDIGAYEWFAAAPGDFSGDGVVDAADYVMWRKTGTTTGNYQDWRANFGETQGSGGFAVDAAPEPQGALVLCSIATLFACATARGQKRAVAVEHGTACHIRPAASLTASSAG